MTFKTSIKYTETSEFKNNQIYGRPQLLARKLNDKHKYVLK